MLVWVTQLGMGIALPLAGFTLLGLWLRNRFSLGPWAVIAGIAVGLICAVDSFIGSLRMLARMEQKKDRAKPPVSFNDHE